MGQLSADQLADQRSDPQQQPAEPAQQQPAQQPEATDQQQGLDGRQPRWTAADTQAAQQNAEIKKSLGLPKSASLATVQRALDNLSAQNQQAPDLENLDPYVAQRLEDADAQVYSMAGATYGDEVRDAAWDLYSATGSKVGFGTFFQTFVNAVERATEQGGATPDEGGDYADDGQQPQPMTPMPSLGDGDVALAPNNTNADPTGGRRDSGDLVGWVKSMGQKMGINPPTG